MKKTSMPNVAKSRARKPANGGDLSAAAEATGTYVYDPALGKIVKVSGRVPKIASHGKNVSADDAGPCGRSECAGGSCAGSGGGSDDF